MIWKTIDRISPSLDELDGNGTRPHGFGTAALDEAPPQERVPTTTRVQLIGTYLRAEGAVDLGNFARLSDYVNLLEGFFTINDVVLLSRLGEPTRITFPDFRVRLDDIAIVGQGFDAAPHVGDRVIPKQRRRLVVTTGAHIIYGYAYLHEDASLTAFVDSDRPAVHADDQRPRPLAGRPTPGRAVPVRAHPPAEDHRDRHRAAGRSRACATTGVGPRPSEGQAPTGQPAAARSPGEPPAASWRRSQIPNHSAAIAGTANHTARSASASRTT